MLHPCVELSPAVAEALTSGRPVVALESTIIAHGLPYPDNRETAIAVEEAVRGAGAVPATIAILDGRLRVGLTVEEIDRVARQPHLLKVSIRDLPVVVGLRRSGATTVAATAQIAAWAGIDVFVTGGIGGVHRGAARTFDISADLAALARLPVAVVCAGAKTVLDLAATLEYLETHGVTVLGYRTDRFPGFYVQSTGLPVDARVESAAEAAAVVRARRSLGLPGAVVLAVPISAGAALDARWLEELLAAAEAELAASGIAGRDVTPFLLRRIHEASGGSSVAANKALILNNARVGAELAVALRTPAG